VTLASGRTSVSGVVDHEAPGRAATAAPTAALIKDGNKSGGRHPRGLRRRGVGRPGLNWSISNLWSRGEVHYRSYCRECSS
jgi:hypothetical protein